MIKGFQGQHTVSADLSQRSDPHLQGPIWHTPQRHQLRPVVLFPKEPLPVTTAHSQNRIAFSPRLNGQDMRCHACQIKHSRRRQLQIPRQRACVHPRQGPIRTGHDVIPLRTNIRRLRRQQRRIRRAVPRAVQCWIRTQRKGWRHQAIQKAGATRPVSNFMTINLAAKRALSKPTSPTQFCQRTRKSRIKYSARHSHSYSR